MENKRKKKRKEKKEKIMTFIVATNVIASRPPERRLTGTPHARANSACIAVGVEVESELPNF